MLSLPVVLAVSYLLGSIPFGYLLVRIFRKEDIRARGSGNIGATNVARSGAKGLGALTLVLDLTKGLLAVLLARHVAPAIFGHPSDLPVLAAVAAVLGHVFPVWLRFRGGKGVATALGAFLALSPRAVLAAVGVFALVLLLTRLVSLASILAAVTFPLFATLLSPDRTPIYLGGVVFVAGLVIVKHHGNIRRILRGTESRFGKPKTITPTPVASSAPETKVQL